MLTKENYSEDHIRNIQNDYHRDPLLIERTIFAFGLLEALARVGLPFTFKGGTSLMLLLPRPMRLSTDIDIRVDPGTDIDAYIEKAKVIFPFIDCGEQKRIQNGNIEKRHFKFIYNSHINAPDKMYILLDVLFEENHYQKTTKREIKNDILLTEGENLMVDIPTIDCILGDKLTAFAPHTTGVGFGEKNMEVMKQFFDVNTLIDEYTDFDCVLKTYRQISETEIAYREIKCTPQDALMDTISAALCVGSRGKILEKDFPNYLDGADRVKNHIFVRGFSMEKAARMAPKIAYMASCLLTETPFERITDPGEYTNDKLTRDDFIKLKNLKKVDPLGYGYLVKADRLIKEFDYTKWQQQRFDNVSSDDFFNADVDYENEHPFENINE